MHAPNTRRNYVQLIRDLLPRIWQHARRHTAQGILLESKVVLRVRGELLVADVCQRFGHIVLLRPIPGQTGWVVFHLPSQRYIGKTLQDFTKREQALALRSWIVEACKRWDQPLDSAEQVFLHEREGAELWGKIRELQS